MNTADWDELRAYVKQLYEDIRSNSVLYSPSTMMTLHQFEYKMREIELKRNTQSLTEAGY